ncbi:MAG: aegerolysin [Cytophagia bacterium]|nr:aegerolysin [Cytophagia bacterium]NBW35828.1 aegerolysin [Cytophagia bacterium]
MAYAQWITVKLSPSNFLHSAHIANAQHSCGKFYGTSKGASISPGTINKMTIANNSSGSVNACGRDNASVGTVGSFDVYDGTPLPTNANRVCTFSWSCPWGSKTNTWGISNKNSQYMDSTQGGSRSSGAIGMISVNMFRK